MQVDRSGRIWAMRPDEMMIAQAVRGREALRGATAMSGPGDVLDGSDFARVHDGVAVIPVRGLLMRQMSWFFWSYEEIARDVALAQASDEVRAIVLDIDSGGGLVAGADDCARAIRASGPKPVAAFVGGVAASAAYYLASAAERITVGSGALVGSIGTVIEYIDVEPMMEAMGARIVRVVAEQSPNKRLDPASAEGKAELQALVDASGREFVETVAEMRGLSADQVLDRFGQGLVFDGDEALTRGMVDGRGTLAGMVAEIAERDAQPVGGVIGRAGKQTGAGLAARTNDNAGAATAAKETSMNWEDLTMAQLREHRADLVEGIESAARTAATTETEAAVTAGVDAALTTERTRVAAIDEIARPGAEALVAQAKAEGWDAGQLALEMVKADKAAGAGFVADLAEADAGAAVAAVKPATTEGAGAGATAEEKAEADWDRNADLRAEFGGDKASYLAFVKAEAGGRVRILKPAR